MPVLVEGISVIIRRAAIERRYKGGWTAFAGQRANGTLCFDSEIARIGFMNPIAVVQFVNGLRSHGFIFPEPTIEPTEIVVIDQLTGPTTPCQWIECFRTPIPGGIVMAARLVGSREQNLVCPGGWDYSRSLSKRGSFVPKNRLEENYDFIGEENNVKCYRDKRTGEKVYIGSPVLSASANQDVPSSERAHAQTLFAEAAALITTHPVANPILTAEDEPLVAKAKADLEWVASLSPQSWNVWWVLGVACRLLKDREGAYAAFRRAFLINPKHVEVGRNLAQECIALGHAKESLEVTGAMLRLAPQDSGLIANHALALLIDGDLEGAGGEVNRAFEMNPSDEVTINVRKIIGDVQAGRIGPPTKVET